MPAAPAPPLSRRYLSVDVLRGLTVAFMILVNDPGDWKQIYEHPSDHAEWNGWTLTDLVFPSFLFLVGCSIVFAVSGRLRRGIPKPRIALQILRRAAIILTIKLFLSAYPHFHVAHLRLLGVLTRIALCYAIAGLLYLVTQRWRVLVLVTAAALLLYWVLLRFVPVPGYGMPTVAMPFLDPDANLASYIDRGFNAFTQQWLHTGSLYRGTRDPEGVLSTLPSVATTLLGVLAGMALVRERPAARVSSTGSLPVRFAAVGALCVLLGELWSYSFPINKNLWTSSYVLLAGGFSLLGLGLCHWVFDEQAWHERHRWVRSLRLALPRSSAPTPSSPMRSAASSRKHWAPFPHTRRTAHRTSCTTSTPRYSREAVPPRSPHCCTRSSL